MKRSGQEAGAGRPEAANAARQGIDPELVRALAEVLKAFDLSEVEVDEGELHIRLARNTAPPQTFAAPAVAPQAAPPIAAAPAASAAPIAAADHPGTVKSPMVGTVYRRANPEGKPFVEVGAQVRAGDRILLVEAMKTFNDIVAPRSGTVIEVLVEDGQPVEYGEPLLIIE